MLKTRQKRDCVAFHSKMENKERDVKCQNTRSRDKEEAIDHILFIYHNWFH